MAKARAAKRRWSPDEIATLIHDYPHLAAAEIARRCGRSVVETRRKAASLGLRKSAEFLASPASGRAQKGSVLPGSRPYRPGRDVSECYGYQAIGTTKILAGQLVRKVTDDRAVSPSRRWVPVSRLVWEQSFGPIPAGQLVTFLPGRHTVIESEIVPESLELVTRAELMRRNNHFNTHPRELAELIQLRGAITRKIKARTKEFDDEEQGQ